MRTRPHRQREILDLRSGVVVIELARDGATLRLEQARYRVAERRLPAMADVQRTGGIGGNELDHHALAAMSVAVSKAIAQRQHARDDRLPRGRCQAEINEAGTRDLGGRVTLKRWFG